METQRENYLINYLYTDTQSLHWARICHQSGHPLPTLPWGSSPMPIHPPSGSSRSGSGEAVCMEIQDLPNPRWVELGEGWR